MDFFALILLLYSLFLYLMHVRRYSPKTSDFFMFFEGGRPFIFFQPIRSNWGVKCQENGDVKKYDYVIIWPIPLFFRVLGRSTAQSDWNWCRANEAVDSTLLRLVEARRNHNALSIPYHRYRCDSDSVDSIDLRECRYQCWAVANKSVFEHKK